MEPSLPARKKYKIASFILLFFLVYQKISSFEISISAKEIGMDIRGEFNRSLLYSADACITGALEFNEMYSMRGGLSLGSTGGSFDIKTFLHAQSSPFSGSPVEASFTWVYNGLPGFETHIHTLLPLFSLNTRFAGITIGPAIRFNEFFGELSVIETFISFSVYAHILQLQKFYLGFRWANYRDFYVGNLSSYSLKVNTLIYFNKNWTMLNEIELLQSGSVALAGNFYGIAYRGGVKYSW